MKPRPPKSGDDPNNARPETGRDTADKMEQALKGIDLIKPIAELDPDERRRVFAQLYLCAKENRFRGEFDFPTAKLMIALHDGRLDEQFQRTASTKDDDLTMLRILADAVRHGRMKTLRAFADAVGRSLRVASADKPKLRRVVEAAVLSGTVPTSGKDLVKPADGRGLPQSSERNARRIARRFGGKPGKRGPQKKAKLGEPAPKKPIEPLAETKRLVAQGSQDFWARRGKK